MKFEDVSRTRVRTLGKRSDLGEISLELSAPDLLSQPPPVSGNRQEPVEDAFEEGRNSSCFGGAVDFLNFGADVTTCSMSTSEPRAKRSKRSTPNHTTVVENLKKEDPCEPKSSGEGHHFMKDFEGVLDAAECEEIAHTIAANTESNSSGSNAPKDHLYSHEEAAMSESSDEETNAALTFA